MAKLTNEELLAIVDAEFASAMGAEGGEISSERADAWNYYLSKELGNEIDGQSSVVTSDVADAVDSIMPSLLRIFTTADNLAEFDPVGVEDTQAAAQESDYVNHVFFKKNPAFMILYTWFFDALVQKNGIVKAWWDDSEIITSESYRGLSEPELFKLMGDDELEGIERTTREVDGQDVTDIDFRRVSKTGTARVENVPPEEYRISSDARSLNPADARMVGQEREITRSELLAMDFDASIVDSLQAHGAAFNNSEKMSRRDKTDELDRSSQDRSQDKILVREAYIRVDYDGDGRSELRQVFTSGNEVLSNELADRQPFHVISPQPLPHKHFGRATAEKVMDNQEVTTTLVRQILDNLYHTNNPGHAVWEQGIGEDTLDDLLTRRVGSYARFARPVNEAYAPMTVPFTAGASFPMLEYFDKVKRDRTGVHSDSEGLSPDSLKNIQTTVMSQASDLSRMKIEAIARIFAETGIKSLFLHLHELVQKHQQKEEIVMLRNEFVPIDPGAWRTRTDMTIKIGLGIGTREQNLLHLEAIWAKQREMVEGGSMNLTVSPKNMFNTAAEFVKNANLKNPEIFFTDPGNQKAPPPSDQQQQLMQQQQQIAQRQQMLDAQKQQIDEQRLANDREKESLKHSREMMELKRKREADQDDFAIEMEKIKNKLTELELNSGVNVPGAGV